MGVVENLSPTKKILMPSNQVDYNIITNEKFDESLYKNFEKFPTKMTKNEQIKVFAKNKRDFNIISNNFTDNHEEKSKVFLHFG